MAAAVERPRPSPGSTAAPRTGARYVATSGPLNAADSNQVATLNGSIGVMRMKNGLGIAAVGIPRTTSAPTDARAAMATKRRSQSGPAGSARLAAGPGSVGGFMLPLVYDGTGVAIRGVYHKRSASPAWHAARVTEMIPSGSHSSGKAPARWGSPRAAPRSALIRRSEALT